MDYTRTARIATEQQAEQLHTAVHGMRRMLTVCGFAESPFTSDEYGYKYAAPDGAFTVYLDHAPQARWFGVQVWSNGECVRTYSRTYEYSDLPTDYDALEQWLEAALYAVKLSYTVTID
jgi:hypothetical protein